MKSPTPFAAVALAILTACDSRDSTDPRRVESRAGAPQTRMVERGPASNNTGTSQAAFLNRLRQSDPQFQTIQRAVLNEQNELGLILNRNVDLDSIPALMRAMLTQMAKEFPGQDLTVVAYAPAQPPVKIGTAHLNAGTRQMSYTRAR